MTVNGGWLNTYSGHKFYPLDPDPGVIRIDDIAHALSNLCRYNGQTPKFYSVAEHSVRLATYTADPNLARFLLLHDASEAYLADIPSPLKVLPCFSEYREHEKRLQATIYRWFDLDPMCEPSAVHDLDRGILSDEATALFGTRRHPEWIGPTSLGIVATDWGWTPLEAEDEFLSTFGYLFT